MCCFRFELRYFDPFLVLDEFSGGLLCFVSSVFTWYHVCRGLVFESVFFLFLTFWVLYVAVTAPAGFPDHPHRGLIFLRKLMLLFTHGNYDESDRMFSF